ncbi:unnamed protein product [Diplocarpon coronariae]
MGTSSPSTGPGYQFKTCNKSVGRSPLVQDVLLTPLFPPSSRESRRRGRDPGRAHVHIRHVSGLSALAGFGAAYLSNSLIPASSDLQWRLPVAIRLGPGSILLVGTILAPETPRFLAEAGRLGEAEAEAVLAWWRGVRGEEWRVDAPVIFMSAGFTSVSSSLLLTGIFGLVKLLSAVAFMFGFVRVRGNRLWLLLGSTRCGLSMFLLVALPDRRGLPDAPAPRVDRLGDVSPTRNVALGKHMDALFTSAPAGPESVGEEFSHDHAVAEEDGEDTGATALLGG